MTIHPLCATGAVLVVLVAAPATARQSPPDAGGPIATQAPVNTPPANLPSAPPASAPVQPAAQGAAASPSAVSPASNGAAAAALRAAVFSGATTGASSTPVAPIAPQPATTSPAPPPPPPAAPIATLGSTSTAAASQTTELAPGLPVKDRTGVVIGQVTSIEDDRKYGQLVTVQMGDESFRLPNDRFGLWGGAATINLTQADIEAQLHRKR